MRLRVKLFATYREIVGAGDLVWSADAGTTVEGFLEAFFKVHPRLAAHRQSMMLAVNQAFVEPSAVLNEGDEIALLPPVSGGVG